MVITAALGASLLFLWLAFHHVSQRSWHASWAQAKPLPWVVYAAACYLLGQFVRGVRLRMLVPGAAMDLGTASGIVVIGYAANNILPARLGELVRAAALAERTGIAVTQALTVTVIERLLDGLAILALLGLASGELSHQPVWMLDVEHVSAVLFGVAFAFFVVAVRWPAALVRGASGLGRAFTPRVRDAVINLAANVTNGAKPLRAPGRLARVAAISVIVWSLEAGMFACVLPSVGLPIRASVATLAMSLTNLGVLIPSSPGFVGPFHYFCSEALVSQGVPQATALTYATLVHLAFFVPVTVWGVGAMLFFGLRIGARLALAGEARRAPPRGRVGDTVAHIVASLDAPPARAKSTPFEVALVEALVDGESPPRDAVVEAADFLAAQMKLLPWSLAALYTVGMAGFRVLVRLRYVRGFCNLGLARRRAIVDWCAFGRLELFRQLFRPVRSTVLLAYYEAPSVVAARKGRSLPLAEAAHEP